MHLMRCLFFLLASFNLRIVGDHIPGVDNLVQKFFRKGLAGSTQRTYQSGQRRFLSFCRAGNFQAVLVSEAVLCRFVASLAEAGLKVRTIKVYLSAVRFMHIAEGSQESGSREGNSEAREAADIARYTAEHERGVGRNIRPVGHSDAVGGMLLGLLCLPQIGGNDSTK